MTILIFPDELQSAVFEIIEPPTDSGSIELTLKIKKTLDEITLNQLKALGVRIITPVT